MSDRTPPHNFLPSLGRVCITQILLVAQLWNRGNFLEIIQGTKGAARSRGGGRGIQSGLVEARTAGVASGLGAGCQYSGRALGGGHTGPDWEEVWEETGVGEPTQHPNLGMSLGRSCELESPTLLSLELRRDSVKGGGEGPRWGQALCFLWVVVGFWGCATQPPLRMGPGLWRLAEGPAPREW